MNAIHISPRWGYESDKMPDLRGGKSLGFTVPVQPNLGAMQLDLHKGYGIRSMLPTIFQGFDVRR